MTIIVDDPDAQLATQLTEARRLLEEATAERDRLQAVVEALADYPDQGHPDAVIISRQLWLSALAALGEGS